MGGFEGRQSVEVTFEARLACRHYGVAWPRPLHAEEELTVGARNMGVRQPREGLPFPQEPVTTERVRGAEGRGRGAGPQERPEECREVA